MILLTPIPPEYKMSIDLCGSNIEKLRCGFGMSQHPRLGQQSRSRILPPDLVHMVHQQETYPPKDAYDQLMHWYL